MSALPGIRIECAARALTGHAASKADVAVASPPGEWDLSVRGPNDEAMLCLQTFGGLFHISNATAAPEGGK